jgi:hypothetical protein
MGEREWLPVPVVIRSGLVNVLRIRVTARAIEGSTVQGEGGVALWLRCLAGPCAAGEKSMHARAGTQRTLSASTVHARRGQSAG